MESTSDEFDISLMYDKSRRLRTSAEIVKEARMSIALTGDRGGAKLVAATRRPETPAYSASSRWARRYASMKLLPMVSEMRPLTSRSLSSIHSEPGSPWQRLSPLPERPQSVCESTEKRTSSGRLSLRRRRPLSVMRTSVKCDEAFSNLRYDIASRKLVERSPNLSRLGLAGARYGVSNSLPSLPLSTRPLESGHESRLSSEMGSTPPDDERSSSALSPRMNESIQMHLKQLTSLFVNGSRPDAELDAWMESFHACLSNEKLFTKRGQTRTLILQSLFLALDDVKPRLTIRVLTVILAMNVSGHNLTKICKAIYALCGNAENHVWFNHDMFLQHFVAALERLSLSDGASMLYLICSLDILATNDPIRRQLLGLPIFESISHVLQLMIARASQEVQPNQLPTTAVLTPTLSSIRTLLDAGRTAKQALLRQDILPQLVYVMKAFSEESELMLYGMRTLSKLSLSEDCCEQLVNLEPDFFLCSSEWLRSYSKNQEIVVRLLFILGNLLSVIERAQWQLFQAPGVVASFQDIFAYFLYLRHVVQREKLSDAIPLSEDNMSISNSGTERSAQDRPKLEDLEDVLVKLARVVANLSVHPGIGSTLCQNGKLLNYLCAVLEATTEPSTSTADELAVNALVALHNLSFYAMDDGVASQIQNRLGEAVLSVINSGATLHCLSEACSLLANLTRDAQFCDWIMRKGVHQQLISFLTLTSSMQLAKAAAGALINLSRCSQYQKALLNSGLLNKSFELLTASVTNYNWYLASLDIQIICNLIRASDDDRLNRRSPVLSHEDRLVLRDVADLLLQHTDESAATSPNELQDDELTSQLRQVWEHEFCFASTELLETLDSALAQDNVAP